MGLPNTYEVEFTPSASRDFHSLDQASQTRIGKRLDALAENPFPQGARKLQAVPTMYRIRVGVFRVIYKVENDRLVVLVIRIRHRREAYRNI